MTGPRSVLLRAVTDLDGRLVDVRLDGPLVTDVSPELVPRPQEEVHDLSGHVLLPAPAEPHAHLDKALTSHRGANATGDLTGAFAVIASLSPFTHEDLVERATRAALQYLAHGATALRTHADLGPHTDLRHVTALVAAREALRGLVDVQVVAFAAPPRTAVEAEALPELFERAVDAGADVVGGAPYSWDDPLAGLDLSWRVAERAGLPLDLHTDETLDPSAQALRQLAERALAEGAGHRLTASHCVSLGAQRADLARETAEIVARAGVGVVALPQTNLYLQARGVHIAPPRGLTAVDALLEAGATVAAGGDNLRDAFNPMGRADPCEAASLMVTAGHRSTREAWHAVSTHARAVMGLPSGAVAAGAPAELLAVRAESVDAAVAGAGTARLVFSGGRLVARTTVECEVHPPPPR